MENLIKIFIAYSRQDHDLLTELRQHTKILERAHKIKIWHDGEIEAGHEWESEIKKALYSADIVLLLISKDFLASDYCYEKEMVEVLDLHRTRKIIVLPIILKPCAWKDAPFAKFQVLPLGGIPIISPNWHSRDEPFLEIVEILKTKSAQIRLGLLLEDPEKAFEHFVTRGDDYFLDMDWQNARTNYRKAIQNWSNGYIPAREVLREKIEFCEDAIELPTLKKVDLRNLHIVAFQDEESRLWGFGNPQNQQILIYPQFDEVITWNFNGGPALKGMDNGLAIIKKNHKIGVIDIIGNIIVPLDYDDSQDIILRLVYLKKGDKWGAFDRFGTIAIPFEYENLNECDSCVISEKNGKKGLLTFSGRQIIPFEYDSFIGDINDEVVSDGLICAEKNGTFGIVSDKNEILIPFEYKSLNIFSEGLVGAQNFDELWGFINNRNEKVVDFKFDDVGDFSNGMAMVEISDYWGLIDQSGQTVLKCQFEDIGWTYSETFIPVKMNGLWGSVTKKGEVVIDFQYEEIGNESEGLIKAKKNGSWGFINQKGEVVIPFGYAWVFEFENGMAEVKEHNGKTYCINNLGEMVDAPEIG